MSRTLSIRLPDELLDSLDETAKASGRSRNALVVEILQERLAELDPEEYQRRWDQTCEAINAADVRDPDLWKFIDAATEDLLKHEKSEDGWL